MLIYISMELENELTDENWPALALSGLLSDTAGSLSQKRAMLWALVLEARGVPCRLQQAGGGWLLLVPLQCHTVACRELLQYEEENRDWPPATPRTVAIPENSLAAVSVLLALAIFHNLIQLGIYLPGNDTPDWYGVGSAKAALILAGQWWRLITALTLHADWGHLCSNLAIGGIFIIFLCRELGTGLAWSLLLGAGALGNLVNAWVQAPGHSSVGASTAVFGAVGILAGISLLRQGQYRRKRWLMPVAAGLSLLALLGTEGKNTDIGAHLFGFIYGGCLGLIVEYLLARLGRPGRRLNAALALSALVTVLVAWWLALARG